METAVDDREVEEVRAVRTLTKAYLLLADGRMIAASELDKFKSVPEGEERKSESRISDDFTYEDDKALVEPPYNPNYLVALLEKSTDHYRCVKAKSNDITGLDYMIVPVEGIDEKKADKSNQKKVKEFFQKCGGSLPFITLMNRVVVDFQTTGIGYIEVTRDMQGDPKNVFQVPTASVRAKVKNKGYVQKVRNREIHFQKWGDKYERKEGKLEIKAFIDSETGNLQPEDKLDIPTAASEIIAFVNYHPGSPVYGLTDVIPAIGAVVGNISAATYNIDFFSNNAVPQYAVIIKGADLSPALEAAITEFFSSELKGKPHRTLIIPVPFTDVEVSLKPLAVEVKDESFTVYRKSNRDEILRAHGVHPARIGIIETGQLGSGSGLSQQENYKNSIVEPGQHAIEMILNHTLVQDGLGVEDWAFKFQDLDIRDKTAEITNGLKELEKGAISINEFRVDVLGKKEIPGGEHHVIMKGTKLVLVKDLGKLIDEGPDDKMMEEMKVTQEALGDTLKSIEESLDSQ